MGNTRFTKMLENKAEFDMKMAQLKRLRNWSQNAVNGIIRDPTIISHQILLDAEVGLDITPQLKVVAKVSSVVREFYIQFHLNGSWLSVESDWDLDTVRLVHAKADTVIEVVEAFCISIGRLGDLERKMARFE